SAPRTWQGTPAPANARSNRSVCALTRTSTAIWRGGTPASIHCLARAATAAASASSSSYSVNSAGGPLARCATRAGPAGAARPPPPPAPAGLGQPVRAADHLRRGSVVPHQLHQGRIRVLRREPRQVGGRGPGERVDRLARVTHHAQVVPVPEPRVQQQLL